LIAAQRAAGEAPCTTLKEQLRPSAPLPAAKAALVALMQTTSNAAAAISIVNLMAGLRSGGTHFVGAHWRPVTKPGDPTGFRSPIISPKADPRCREIGPVLA
jgi:hypothetical protein